MDKSLPLLNFTVKLYPDVDLKDVAVVACQHILGSTLSLFEELFAKGLKPENTYLIGKCYSTSSIVFDTFKKSGVRISSESTAFKSEISFDEQFQNYIDNFVKEIPDISKFKKVIILDDGAHLLLYANDFFKDFSNIVGVEQTSSGYHRLKDVRLNFPVINVARSPAKLERESPMIAELIVFKIQEYFQKYNIVDPKILIVGKGVIGEQIHRLLESKHFVMTHDLIQHKSTLVKEYKQSLGEFDVIIGATGNSILEPGDFSNLKKGVLLISASSSDREFSASYLRALCPKMSDCHHDFQINGITLINSGFPVNFNKDSEHSLEPRKIQLTRALLLAGIYQSMKISKNKDTLVDLDVDIQTQIVSKFKGL